MPSPLRAPTRQRALRARLGTRFLRPARIDPQPAIQEDASAPAAVTNGTATVTTASFTPVANSLLVAIACGGGGTAVQTVPVTDSLGSTWTLLKRANTNNFAGETEIWVMDAGASPSARTVTATITGSDGFGVELCVKVLTGAKPAASCLGGFTVVNTTTAYTISITTTTTDSLACAGLVDSTGSGALTANGITTAWQSVNDGGSGHKYAAFRATSLTGTPGATTIGFTNTAGNNQAIVAVEILAATGGSFSRSASDTAAATDAATRALVLARPSSETSAATDAVTRTLALARPTSDTAAATDAATRTSTQARAASETASATDVATGTVFSGQSRTASDTAAATDVATRTLVLARATSDTAVATDAATRTSTRTRTATDAAAAMDATARTLAMSRPVADTAAATDAVTRSSTRGRTASDTAAATDAAVGALGGGQSRTASDTAAATDAASRAAQVFSRTAPSTAAATDAATRTTARARATADTAAATDAVTKSLNRTRTVSETATASDVAGRAAQVFARAAADTALAVDAAAGVQTGGTTYRPFSGTTGRPNTGTTARPSSGTTSRPSSGTTIRPFTTITPRP